MNKYYINQMQNKTIQQLNQLNHDFYQQVAADFSQSRDYFWEGWGKLIPTLKQELPSKFSVLDLGCGNGRFFKFLQENFPTTRINYTGVDSSSKLLNIAQSQLPAAEFIQLDLINGFNKITNNNYNLIVGFGLMHHIPSYNLRLEFLENFKKLNPKLIILSFWQFHKSLKLLNKQVDPNLIKINKNNLEEGDYILDWQRGVKGYRYCHSFSDAEIKKLTKQANLKTLLEFNADGGEDKLNKYLILGIRD